MKKRAGLDGCPRNGGRRKTEPSNEGMDADPGSEAAGQGNGFHACYLLNSVCPRVKGRTYIGYTVNPKRRIRQHNGEITSGAFRTKKFRPWEMVLCIFGFPTNVSALQFEWAWQHPKDSIALRKDVSTFKSFSGVANKIKLAYTMLNLLPWKGLNLVVNYFSTKYIECSAGCPSLLPNMKVQFVSMDELPCYLDGDLDSCQLDNGDEEEDDRNFYRTTITERNGSAGTGALHEFDTLYEETDLKIDQQAKDKEIPQGSDNEITEVSILRDQNHETTGGSSNTYKTTEMSPDHNHSIDMDSFQVYRCCGMYQKRRTTDLVFEAELKSHITDFPETVSTSGNEPVLLRGISKLRYMGAIHQQREVIDLSSPSPCKIAFREKIVVFPEIIDLT